ncbi:hypothetical protein J2746_001786 [Methanolobus bombayensis]|nr:hypothetical protein [Methanolobus bombayensis]
MTPSLETCKACVHLACYNYHYVLGTYTPEPSGVKVFRNEFQYENLSLFTEIR